MYSYIGYTGTERQATASGIINATLTEDSRTLDEVVVVGYGVQKKSSVTGAISQVKSEDMLKDAASSAIYGIAAGNGVVLITTKKGTAGKTSVSYDFQASAQSIARIPQVMNAEQYIDYMTEAQYISMDAFMQNYDFQTNTDWSKEVFESSIMSRHRVSWFSVFGRLTYDYANRYFLQASLRRDGADLSTLPLKKRYGYFPAVSLGWAVSNESFFESHRHKGTHQCFGQRQILAERCLHLRRFVLQDKANPAGLYAAGLAARQGIPEQHPGVCIAGRFRHLYLLSRLRLRNRRHRTKHGA